MRGAGGAGRLTLVPAITDEASGGRTAHPRVATVEQPTCSTSCIGAADTIDGLRLDDEVADQLLHAKRTPWTQGSTAEVKDSHAGGLHEHSDVPECVTSKDPRSGLYVTQSTIPRVQLADDVHRAVNIV